MKIRHRLNLTILITLLAFLSIAWIYLQARQQLANEQTEQRLMQATVKAVGDLETLAYDLFLGGTERAYLQWRSRHESAAKFVRALEDQQLIAPQESTKLSVILDDVDEHMVAMWMARNHAQRTDDRRLQNHLLVQLHEATSRIDRTLIRVVKQQQQGRADTNKAILLLMLFAAITTIAMLVWLHLSVNLPLARLRNGVHQLTTGSLDIQVETSADDEIGELSREFQTMSARLSTVMASRDELDREVAQRAAVERALRESEGRFRTLVENAPEAIIVLDTESGHFVDINKNAEHMYGLNRQELLEIGLTEISPEIQENGAESAALARHFTGQALAGSVPVFEWTHKLPDGTLFPAEIRMVRLPSSGQRLVRGSIIDISERKRHEQELKENELRQRQLVTDLRSTQAQLVQAEKLSAMGTLISGVAHEINNPLMAILNYVQYVKTRIKEERLIKYLSMAEKETKRASRVTTNMLAYARGPEKEDSGYENVDMANVVTSALEIIGPRIREMHVELESALPTQAQACIQANADEVMQVLINLFNNALDAMKDVQHRRLSCRLRQRDDIMELEVTDSGPGIPRDIRARIFDPFFTTKPAGQGTGLGLAVSHQLVKGLGGELRLVESRVGARFLLRLPISVDSCGDQPSVSEDTTADPMGKVGT